MIFRIDFISKEKMRTEFVFHETSESIIADCKKIIGTELSDKIVDDDTILIDIYTVKDEDIHQTAGIHKILTNPDNATSISRLCFQYQYDILKSLQKFVETQNIFQLSV